MKHFILLFIFLSLNLNADIIYNDFLSIGSKNSNSDKIIQFGNNSNYMGCIRYNYTERKLQSSNDCINYSDSVMHNPVTILDGSGLTINENQNLSLDIASSITTGALSNLDWITFNNKQDLLDFIPENIDNKSNDVSLNDNSNIKYTTEQAVRGYVAGEINSIDFSPYLKKDGSVVMDGNFNMGGYGVRNVSSLISPTFQVGTQDAYSRNQIWDYEENSILRLGSLAADGDAPGDKSTEGAIFYGANLQGSVISSIDGNSNFAYARIKPLRFGLYNSETLLGANYIFKVDPTSLYLADNSYNKTFEVNRVSGNVNANFLTLVNPLTAQNGGVVESNRIFHADSSRTDPYTESGSSSKPFKNLNTLFTAMESDITNRISAGETRSDCRYVVEVAPGTYTDDITIPSAAMIQINMAGAQLSGTITRTVSQVGFGSSYYSKLIFNGAQGNRAEKGKQATLSGNITFSTLEGSSYLYYTVFSGIYLSGNITVSNGVNVMLLDHTVHYDATKNITGVGNVLLEMSNLSRIKATLVGDINCYNCANSELAAINTTPTDDSVFRDMVFSGAITINGSGTLNFDASSYDSFKSMSPSVIGSSINLLDKSSGIANESTIAGSTVTDALNNLNSNKENILTVSGLLNRNGDDINLYSVDSKNINFTYMGNTNYKTLYDYINIVGSVGSIEPVTITSINTNYVSVDGGSGLIKSTDLAYDDIRFFSWNSNTLNIVNDTINYIYVDYNAGNPVVNTTTNLADINKTTKFTIGAAFTDGVEEAHSVSVGLSLSNWQQNEFRRLTEVRRAERAVGLVVSETGTRNLSYTAGVAYIAGIRKTYTAKDTSSTDKFTYVYRNGSGGWTYSYNSNQISNLLYDNGSGTLATLANGQYGVHWIYILADGDFYVLYGQASYVLANAQAAIVPSVLPNELSQFAILAAKVLVLKNATSLYSISSAYTTLFPVSSPSDHNDLGNIQGGAANEYYHLDNNNYVKTINASTLFTQTSIQSISNTNAETTLIGSGHGTLTLPANSMITGKTYRIKIRGEIGTVLKPSTTVAIKLGSTTLYTDSTTLSTTLASTNFFDLEYDITCVSTGSTGSVNSFGKVIGKDATGTIIVPYNGGVDTINTTVNNNLDVTFKFGTASPNNNINSYITTIEQLY